MFIGKPASVSDCIQRYNKLKTQQHLEIAAPHNLNEKVKDVIDTDLRRWAESEGQVLQ
jgi:predicted CopG family antitoxin